MDLDQPPTPGPLTQSWLDFFEQSPPQPWPPTSAGQYAEWLQLWAAYAESLGLVVPLPLATPGAGE